MLISENLSHAISWRKAWEKYRTFDCWFKNLPPTKEEMKKRKDRMFEKIRLADERYKKEMEASRR